MIEAAMVSTLKGCTKNSLMTLNPSVSTKRPIEIKSLHQFTETLDFKHKTYVRRFVASKAKRKAKKR